MKPWTELMMAHHVQWVLAGLWILLILPTNGYIINQDGHLVPYKVYKKGQYSGNRMCLLTPRNCKGGRQHHKRAESEVFKRQMPQQNHPEMFQLYDDKRNDPFTKGVPPAVHSFTPDLSSYQDLHMSHSPDAYGLMNKREDKLHDNDKMTAVYANTDDNSELYNRFAHGNANVLDDYRHRGIAEPPPLDRKVNAIVEEYPIYDTLQALLANYYEQADHASNIYDPTDDLFAIRKRR